jgi:hypothetical protein
MKKKPKQTRKLISFLAVVVFVLLSGPVKSQAVEPYFSIGYGSYRMSDLKKLQSIVIQGNPLPLQITDNFPMYVNYEAGMIVPISALKQKIGFSFGGMSTGGRATVSDYSGAYYFDQKVQGFIIGGIYEILIKKYSHCGLSFNGNISYILTKYQLREELNVGDYSDTESLDMKASGICFEPRLKFTIPVKRLLFSLQTGYFVDLSSKLSDKSTNEGIYIGKEEIRADFSGVRINATCSYRIGKL